MDLQTGVRRHQSWCRRGDGNLTGSNKCGSLEGDYTIHLSARANQIPLPPFEPVGNKAQWPASPASLSSKDADWSLCIMIVKSFTSEAL